MNATTNTERLISCMICGDRFETVADSIGHSCFTGETPEQSITAAEAAIFGDLLALEDAASDARTAIAFAPITLPDNARIDLTTRRQTIKARQVTAFDAGYAAIGDRMRLYSAYRTLAAYAHTLTLTTDI